MDKTLGRLREPIYTLMRVAVGILFSFHGAQKLFGLFGGHQQRLISVMGLAGSIELVCGLLVAVGLFSGIASLVAALEMLVAYFWAHFPRGPIPIENRGELALLYLFVFLFIAGQGGGRHSLHRVFFHHDDAIE